MPEPDADSGLAAVLFAGRYRGQDLRATAAKWLRSPVPHADDPKPSLTFSAGRTMSPNPRFGVHRFEFWWSQRASFLTLAESRLTCTR